ncbi:MAG: Cna B-type domain-containing protein [Oscillospiraceae bacterium]|jgi:hypothetical protein|nr:Cna B-type domain-containing protein [Oscillospiraceae bacterium]
MRAVLHDNIKLYLQRRKRRRRIIALVSVFAVLTVAAVYSLMVLPAMGKVGAEFSINIEDNKAAFGDAMALRVNAAADADAKDEAIFFLISAESTGSGLSEEHKFDAGGVTKITADNGATVELHRQWTKDGSANARGYWFTLKPGESAAFTLNCRSDTALYSADEWLFDEKDVTQATEQAAAVDNVMTQGDTEETAAQAETQGGKQKNSVPLLPLQTVTAGRPQKLEMAFAAAQSLEKAWKLIDEKEKNDGLVQTLTLTWMDAEALPQGEPSLSATTESGLVITMTGPSESFPAETYLLNLKAEELLSSAQDKTTAEAQRAEAAQESLENTLTQAGMQPVDQWLFDLRLTQDDTEVGLLGPVTITVEGFASEDTALTPLLYEVDETAETGAQEVQAQRQSDTLVMETASVSTYAVVLAAGQFGTVPSGSFEWQLSTDANPFGEAAKFNLFCLGNLANIPDVEGTVAVGGNMDFSVRGFSAAGYTSPTSGLPVVYTPPYFIFNGSSIKGRINASTAKQTGNIWVNPSLSIEDRKRIGYYGYDPNSYADEISEFQDINSYFSSIGNSLKTQNARMTNIAANGTVSAQYGNLTFTGTDTVLNVFHVSAAQLLSDRYVWNFDVPDTSSVLVNITGSNAIEFKPAGVMQIKGQQYQKNSSQYISMAGRIVWNFAPNITSVTVLSGGDMLMGSVMAPSADFNVTGVGAGFNGTVAVGSLDGGSSTSAWTGFECHYFPSTFTVPPQEICDKTVVVNKIWENCTPPAGATVCVVLKKDDVVIDTVTLNGTDDNWSHTWSNLARGTYTIEQTSGPDGYSSAVYTITDTDEEQLFQITAARELTGDMTVNVTKTWAGGTPGASSVTLHLLLNGARVEPDRTITLSAANNWSGSFTNLPDLDDNGDAISYSVEEDSVSGWVPELSVTTTPRQAAHWNNITGTTTLENEKIYRFVNSGKALTLTSTANNGISGQTDNVSAANQQWRAVNVSNGGASFRLQNVGTPTRYISYYNNSTTPFRPLTSGTSFSLNASGKLLSTQYIVMNASSGVLSRNSNVNNATAFTVQTYVEAVSPKVDITVTNHPVTPPEMMETFKLYKQIDAFHDGAANPDTTASGADLYRLYLEARNQGYPIDLVLVVDRSGSMAENASDGVRKDQAVRNLLNGVNGQNGFTKSFLDLNPENNLAIVWFGGDWTGSTNSAYFNTRNESGVVQSWTQNKNYQVITNESSPDSANNISYRASTGTNYMAGMWAAADMLRSDSAVANNGHKKMVVFLTDGLPTYYIQKTQTNTAIPTYQEYLAWKAAGRPSTFWRTGAGSSTNDAERNATMTAFNDFVSQNPGVIMSNIMFSQNTIEDTVLERMIASGGKDYKANAYEDLPAVFADVIALLTTSKNFSITDDLSKYVQWYGTQPDLKVVRTTLLTGQKDVLWQSSGAATHGVIGAATANNTVVQNGQQIPIIQSVTFTPSSSGNSTGTVKLLFSQEYRVDLLYMYTLSFNVETTQTAYDEFSQNKLNGDSTGYNGTTGDPETDYGSNTTSSGRPGFHANSSAIVRYRLLDQFFEDTYDHPVIQVGAVEFIIKKTDITGNILLPNAKFDLYRAAAQGDAGAVLIPGTSGQYGVKINQAALTIGLDGTLKVENLTADTYFLVETAAPSGYVLLADPISFTLDSGTLSVLGASQMAQFSGTDSNGTPILTVKNTDGYTLPATGGGGIGLYVGIAFVLMALPVILLTLKKRRYRG